MESAAPSSVSEPARSSQVLKRKVTSASINDLQKDAHHFVTHETNSDMKRMLAATVGRMAKPRDERWADRQKFTAFLQEEQENISNCLRFPLVLAYFLFWTTTVLMHEDISNVSQVERHFRNMIEGTSFEGLQGEHPVSGHKTMEDIDVAVDIWTYLYDAIIPLFIPDLSTTASDDMNRALRYNQLIGGVQLQQIRRPKTPCIDEFPNLGPKREDTGKNPLLTGFYCFPWNKATANCFGPGNSTEGFCPDQYMSSRQRRRLSEEQLEEEWHEDIEDDSWHHAFGRILYQPRHASKVKGQSESVLTGGAKPPLFTVLLHEHEGLAFALKKLKDLEALEWVDTATSWVGVKMFLLNPDLAVYTHVIINVWFPPSGELIPAVVMNSFPAEPYQKKSRIAADVFFGLLWFHLFGVCVLGLMKACITKELKAYWSNFWNWVNWISVMGGIIIIVLWFVFLAFLSSVQDMVMEVVTRRPSPEDNYLFATEFQKNSYLDMTDKLQAEVSNLAGFLMYYRLCICWYTIIIMVRFFQAFQAQPRLAMVTNTIARSITDIAHFAIVLVLVFLAYAVAGMFLFGHRLLEFSELRMAIHQCFLVMLGSFDFSEMANEYPVTAALWFWSYMILVSLIMLNMALAIVLDIYSEVKIDAQSQDEIWTQAYTTLQATLFNRDWVSYQEIEDAVNKLDPEVEKVSGELLVESVQHMTPKQARDLLEKAEKREEELDSKGLSMSDAMKMVGWIKIAVQKIAQRIEDIILIEEEEKELLEQTDDKDFVASMRGGLGSGGGGGHEFVTLDPAADNKLQNVERRLAQMEEFLNENMVHTVTRGKEMRNRLTLIEDLLQGNKDALAGTGTASRSDAAPAVARPDGGGSEPPEPGTLRHVGGPPEPGRGPVIFSA
mmetsp:Transcript_41578/g.90628  ORF Transcript_41578/g.90628 Transcript_41578/m.90628 type:complete len:892 (+) Transcript_41578:73-2748(+)